MISSHFSQQFPQITIMKFRYNKNFICFKVQVWQILKIILKIQYRVQVRQPL